MEYFNVGDKKIPSREYHDIIDDAVRWAFDDWHEDEGIGTSDISCVVNEALGEMGFSRLFLRADVDRGFPIVEKEQIQMIRKFVSISLGRLIDSKQ